MELEVVIKAKVELLEGDEGQEADSRGSEKTYYLAWEHEDLNHPSNRYRDMPEEQGRDWAGLVNNVIGGIALAGGAAALAYAAPYVLAGTKIGAVVFKGLSAAQAGQKLGAAVFLAGSMSTIGLGVSDFMSNRVSSREEYLRRAMAGSISGFLSGASTLMLADAGLAAVMGGGFAEGFVSELITQKLLNEDGSIQWGLCFSSGILNAFLDGYLYKNVSKNEESLLDNTGKFLDEELENNYQKYVSRNQKAGKAVRERLDWKKASDYWTRESLVARGNRYNQTVKDADIYPYHEIHLENGKKLDSYDLLAGEIISRKATDLDKITEETYRKYLSEFSDKYSVGTTIRSNKYPELDGLKLEGEYILEIPSTNAALDNIEYFEDIANEYNVKLRFTEEG